MGVAVRVSGYRSYRICGAEPRQVKHQRMTWKKHGKLNGAMGT